jgi:hypothetical protein
MVYRVECERDGVYRIGDKRRNDGHVYYDATSNLKIERVRDELAEQREAFETSQKEVLERITVTMEKSAHASSNPLYRSSGSAVTQQ